MRRSRKIEHRDRRLNSLSKQVTVVLLTLVGAVASAHAALGGTPSSVQSDQSWMKATRTESTRQNYTVHVMVLPRGNVVREYVSSSGQVFAVTWCAR